MLAHPGAFLERCVAVEAGRSHLGDAQFAQAAELVGGQGLGRRQVQDGAAVETRGDRRSEVRQGFPRRRTRRNDHVSATECQVGRFVLMRPESCHPAVRQARNKYFRRPIRPLDLTRLTCWNMLHMGDTLVTCGNAEQVLEEWTCLLWGGSGGSHCFQSRIGGQSRRES